MNIIIILSSLFISSFLSFWLYDKTNQKLLCILATILFNTLILGSTTWALYYSDIEAKLFGVSNSEYYYLIFSIPIVSWVSVILIFMVSKRAE